MKTTIKEFLNEKIEDIKLNDNFWKWFDDSKVINEDGKPKICYHGSRSKFDIFKPSKSVGNQGEKDQIEGIYFTDNKEGASFFSMSDDERYLKPVFLSFKNPYFVSDYNVLKKVLDITKLSQVNEILKNMGYDSLIMEKGFFAIGGHHRLYLAFYPNQIKSINNDGSWDVNDNNIYS